MAQRSLAGNIYRRNPALNVTTSTSRKFHGMDRVLRNLNAALTYIEVGSAAGLVEAAEFIHADTEKTPPLTPVDTGNLRSSWTTRFFRKNKQSVIIFGYSANYALYVHERLGPTNWSRKNSGAKWFEYAIKRNADRIFHLISKGAKIKR